MRGIEGEPRKELIRELLRIDEWLRNKSASQLQTYYKFILRQYQPCKPVQL